MAVIEIDTIEKLVAFSGGEYGRGTSGEYLDVVLTADLDFNDLKEYDNPYNWAGCTGTWYINFDGQGHKVDNIYYSGTADWGFFGTVYGSVKNLYLPNMFVTSTASVAGVAVYLRGTLTNAHVSGHLETLDTNDRYAACGLYFQAISSSINQCSMSGLLKGSSTGGIAQGTTSGNTLISSCLVIADMIAIYTAAPFAYTGHTINNCEYRGTVKAGSNVVVGGWQIPIFNSILVYYPETTNNKWRSNSTYYNVYYDSTLAAEGGFTPPSITGAPTTDLQDGQWLHDHGFAI